MSVLTHRVAPRARRVGRDTPAIDSIESRPDELDGGPHVAKSLRAVQRVEDRPLGVADAHVRPFEHDRLDAILESSLRKDVKGEPCRSEPPRAVLSGNVGVEDGSENRCVRR